MLRLCLALLLLLGLGACAKKGHVADEGMHKDHPPHGGTPVTLGSGTFHLEFVRDAADGRLDAYLLDDEMANFVRVPATHFDVVAGVGRELRPLRFHAVANAATGETVGDTSCFEVQADWLKTTDDFDVVLMKLDVGDTTFSGVAFNFPRGNAAQ